MFKRVALSFMGLALCLYVTPVQAVETDIGEPSSAFADLKDLDEITKAKFDAMIYTGIFNGVSENTFGLEGNINRAQFAKVAALIFGLEVDDSLKTSPFKDVKSDDPAYGYALPYIAVIHAAGITTGIGNGEFNPSGEVTKEQLATFLVRGLGRGEEPSGLQFSQDSTVSNWAGGYVQRALDLGLLDNNPDGTFGGKEEASRALLVTGGYETARTLEETKPLEISGADFAAGNKLLLTLTVGIDAKSVDLSKITINGVPLNPNLDSFVLSEDKKTIIINLHDGFQLDTSKTPVIAVNGLKTQFGNDVKNDESNKIPVTLTEPPVNSTAPIIQEPKPTPEPTNSNQGSNSTEGTESPNQGPNPNAGTESPNQGPNPNAGTENPNQGPNPNAGTENPNQGPNPNAGTENPNQGPNPNAGTESPNQGPDPTPGTTNPNQS